MERHLTSAAEHECLANRLVSVGSVFRPILDVDLWGASLTPPDLPGWPVHTGRSGIGGAKGRDYC